MGLSDAESFEQLAEISEQIFGSGEVRSGAQKFGTGLVELDLAMMVEGGGKVVAGGSKIFTLLGGAATALDGGAEASATSGASVRLNLFRKSGEAAFRNPGLQEGLAAIEPFFPEGSFSIFDWSGYPEGVPRPQGPFRMLEGAEYDAARDAANAANRRMHRADSALAGKNLHGVHPVKFGGDPVSQENKIALTQAEHSPLTTWWNRLMRSIRE